MSHTTTLKAIAIRDVQALKAAALDLKSKGVNCELVENARPRMYYANQHGNCPFVLKLPGSPYDIGFDLQEDGTYAPVMDTWGGHIQKQVGISNPTCELPKDRSEAEAAMAIGKFSQAYAKHAAINAAVNQGYMVESADIDQKGNVNLVLTGF